MNSTNDAMREHAVKTAKMIGRIATGIALAAMATSYMVQVGLLVEHQVGWSSFVIPISLDALAVCALMARRLPGLDQGTRRIASVITLVMASISFAGNTYGAHDIVAGIGHAVPVLGLLLAETLAGRVLAHAHKLTAEAHAESAKTVVVPDTAADLESPELPEAPVSPGPVGQNSKAGRKPIPATVGPNGRMVHAKTGEPLKTRTEQRKRTGK